MNTSDLSRAVRRTTALAWLGMFACGDDASLGQKPDTDSGTDGTAGATRGESGSDAGRGADSDSDSGTDTGDPDLVDPCLDSIGAGAWQTITQEGAPLGTAGPAAVIWTGTYLMILSRTAPVAGGLFDVCTGAWTPMSEVGRPAADGGGGFHTIWAEDRLVVWRPAGDTLAGRGATFDPETSTWFSMNVVGAPTQSDLGDTFPGFGRSAIVDGRFLVVSEVLNPGVEAESVIYGYTVSADRWEPLEPQGAPGPRTNFELLRAGSRLLVWGGTDGQTSLHNGAFFDPDANAWAPIPSNGAAGNYAHGQAVKLWTGDRFVVWGGAVGPDYVDDGYVYTPAEDRWDPLSLTGAPSFRSGGAQLVADGRFIVWGGNPRAPDPLADDPIGALYDFGAGQWTEIAVDGAPPLDGVGNASGLVIGPGRVFVHNIDGGPWKLFDPTGNAWTDIDLGGAPPLLHGYHAVWTGGRVIVWGGADYPPCDEPNCIGEEFYNYGGMYRPE